MDDELRNVARRQLTREPAPQALVGDNGRAAYLCLLQQRRISALDHTDFVAVAGTMRPCSWTNRAQRGGGIVVAPLDDDLDIALDERAVIEATLAADAIVIERFAAAMLSWFHVTVG